MRSFFYIPIFLFDILTPLTIFDNIEESHGVKAIVKF